MDFTGHVDPITEADSKNSVWYRVRSGDCVRCRIHLFAHLWPQSVSTSQGSSYANYGFARLRNTRLAHRQTQRFASSHRDVVLIRLRYTFEQMRSFMNWVLTWFYWCVQQARGLNQPGRPGPHWSLVTGSRHTCAWSPQPGWYLLCVSCAAEISGVWKKTAKPSWSWLEFLFLVNWFSVLHTLNGKWWL